jgi:hypothetical protein
VKFLRLPLKYWFPAKRHGWGWGLPCRWQGWVVLAAYVLFLIGGAIVLGPGAHLAAYLIYVIALSVILLVVAWLKGEPPRWRWGDK